MKRFPAKNFLHSSGRWLGKCEHIGQTIRKARLKISGAGSCNHRWNVSFSEASVLLLRLLD